MKDIIYKESEEQIKDYIEYRYNMIKDIKHQEENQQEIRLIQKNKNKIKAEYKIEDMKELPKTLSARHFESDIEPEIVVDRIHGRIYKNE